MPPIGNCFLDLTKPPPISYLVDPMAIEEGRVRERVAQEIVRPGGLLGLL
jgi:hypothetical protein